MVIKNLIIKMEKIIVKDENTGVTFIFNSHKDKEKFFECWDDLVKGVKV